MQEKEIKVHGEQQIKTEDTPYERPAIIYEGMISTRAGTPISSPGTDGNPTGVDLFGD